MNIAGLGLSSEFARGWGGVEYSNGYNRKLLVTIGSLLTQLLPTSFAFSPFQVPLEPLNHSICPGGGICRCAIACHTMGKPNQTANWRGSIQK